MIDHDPLSQTGTGPANRDEDFSGTGSDETVFNIRSYSADDAGLGFKVSDHDKHGDLDILLGLHETSFVHQDRHDDSHPGSPLTRAFAARDWWFIHGDDIDFGDDLEVIGDGSISVVLKAKLDDEDVAVKILRTDKEGDRDAAGLPTYGLDLRDELAALSGRLSHPNIVGFKGAGSVFCLGSVVPMIVYEFMSSSVEDLFAAKTSEMASRKRGEVWVPPTPLGLAWAHQLFSALSYLHTCDTPMAHRDLKPANLLVSNDLQTVKVADFSLATPLKQFCSDDCTTIPSLAGSLRYMAPEVARRQPFDLAAADVYSGALTAWSLIHGQRPLHTINDAKSALSCTCSGLRPPVKDDGLRRVLAAGWDGCPQDRATAGEMAAALLHLSQKRAEPKNWRQKVLAKVKKSFTRTISGSAGHNGNDRLKRRLNSSS